MQIQSLVTLLLLIFTFCTTFKAAAQPISAVSTTAADVTINATGTAKISITPTTNLTAGTLQAGTVLGTFTATANQGTLVWRYTPGSGTIIWPWGKSNQPANTITLTGQNNSKDTLSLYFTSKDSTIQPVPNDPSGTWVMLTPKNSDTGSVVNGSLNATNATGYKDQQVNADTYVLSMDAAIWQS